MSERAGDDATGVESRRGFLRTVLVAGSGAAVLGATSTAVAVGVQEETARPAEARDSGYRETPHIRDYYKSTAL